MSALDGKTIFASDAEAAGYRRKSDDWWVNVYQQANGKTIFGHYVARARGLSEVYRAPNVPGYRVRVRFKMRDS